MGVLCLTAMGDLNVAVGDAVQSAKDAYDEADANPLDHGFAHIEGVDGRTRLAQALKEHPDVQADDWDYVTVSGLSRYLTPQQRGYRAFIETLEDYGVDTDGIYVRGRLD